MSKEMVAMWIRLAGPGIAGLLAGDVAGHFGGEWLENRFDLPDETSILTSITLALIAAVGATKYIGIPVTKRWADGLSREERDRIS